MYSHNFFFTLFTYTLAFIVETEYSNAKSDRNILKIIRAEEDARFYKLVVHNNGRWIYVGARTEIYQLSADLESQIASFKLEGNECENLVLELDYQNQQLISCNSRCCHFLNIANISQIINKTTEFPDIHLCFKLIVLQNSSTLYYSTTKRGGKIQVLNLERGGISSNIEEVPLQDFKSWNGRFIYGYNSGDVGYFLANDISSVCETDHEHFINSIIASRSGYLYEIQYKKTKNQYTGMFVTCDYDFTTKMSLELAYFYDEYESDPESETDFHKVKRKILFAVFQMNEPRTGFKVCRYYLNETYSVIQTYRILTGEPIYHYVGAAGVTAMTVASINNHTILFFLTFKGHLHKVSIKGFDSPDARTANIYADITIDEGWPLNSHILFDSKKNSLYAMTPYKIAKIKIHNCDEYSTPYACLDAKDPYCGWCFPSNRCCLKSECHYEKNRINWISYDIDKYVEKLPSPTKIFFKTGEWNVTFNLLNSHPFNNHTIICSFKFNNTIIKTTTSVSDEDQINCGTPNPQDLPPILINEHFEEAQLSLRIKDFPEFHNTSVKFIDCGSTKLCSKCLNSGECYWYVNEQKCLENSIHPNSFDSCDGSCSTRQIYTTSSDKCPHFRFESETSSHLYIHADTEKKEIITLWHRIPTNTTHETIECKFDIDGNETITTTHARYVWYSFDNSSSGTIECDETTFTYAAETANIIVQLSVLWNRSIYLENWHNQHIILYKCANMGHQCTTCLDKNYTCIFNSKTGECKYDNSTNVELDINSDWWNDTKKCPDYIITRKITGTHWLIENIHWIIITIVVITFTIITIFIIVYRKKAKVSQKMQQQINKMGMEMIAMSQWVKRVVIENEIQLDENESNMLKLPNVTIVYTSIPRTAENDTTPQTEYEIPLDEKWEIPRDNLVLGKCLGEGEFGRVVEGNVTGHLQQDVVTTVAVKMLKNIHSDIDMISLVKEMELMKLIERHENVLSLLGCCTQDGPLYIITEYSPHGNLLDFLRNRHRPSKTQDITSNELPENVLITFALQVAIGMKYLASIKCIHRDLAARNVLVFDNYNVKIADFGLARDIRHDYYYRQKTKGRLPVKWMAPETLIKKRYTTQSDVWSYGVLLWEIMSFGSVPYLAYDDAEKLLEDIQAGYRMKKPDGCSIMMYSLMCKCWNYLPEDRPEFSKIIHDLKVLLGDDAIIECPDSDCSDSDSSNSTISHHIMKNETDALLENNCQ